MPRPTFSRILLTSLLCLPATPLVAAEQASPLPKAKTAKATTRAAEMPSPLPKEKAANITPLVATAKPSPLLKPKTAKATARAAEKPSLLPESGTKAADARPANKPSQAYWDGLAKDRDRKRDKKTKKNQEVQEQRELAARRNRELAQATLFYEQAQTLAYARNHAQSLDAQRAAQAAISAQLREADRYENERRNSSTVADRSRTNSPYDDPAWIASRRLEAARIESEITRLAVQVRQQQQQNPAGSDSVDRFRYSNQGGNSGQSTSYNPVPVPTQPTYSPPPPTYSPPPPVTHSAPPTVTPSGREYHVGATKH